MSKKIFTVALCVPLLFVLSSESAIAGSAYCIRQDGMYGFDCAKANQSPNCDVNSIQTRVRYCPTEGDALPCALDKNKTVSEVLKRKDQVEKAVANTQDSQISHCQRTNVVTTADSLFFRFGPADRESFCADPVGQVSCSREKQPVFDSKCRSWLPSPDARLKTNIAHLAAYRALVKIDPARLSATEQVEYAKCKTVLDSTKKNPDYASLAVRDLSQGCFDFVANGYPESLAFEKYKLYANERVNEGVFNEKDRSYRPKTAREKLREYFNEAKVTVLARLEEMVPEGDDQKSLKRRSLLKKIIARVEAITLNDSPMNTNSSQLECLADESVKNAGYLPASNQIQVCVGALAQVNNAHPAVFHRLFGHEIAHSFDPCALFTMSHRSGAKTSGYQPMVFEGEDDEAIQSFKSGLVGCLAKNDVRIRNEFPDPMAKNSFVSSYPPSKKGSKGLDLQAAYDQSCAAMEATQGKNQVMEAWADYFGAMTVAAQAKGKKPEEALDAGFAVAQFFSGQSSCPSAYPSEADSHPDNNVRVKRVIFSNPDFRSAIGCSEPPVGTQSCGLDWAGK